MDNESKIKEGHTYCMYNDVFKYYGEDYINIKYLKQMNKKCVR